MSILRKILGLTETPVREKIPRAPRIRLQAIHHVVLTSPRWDGQVMKVINVSTTGLGVEDVGRPEDLIVGTLIPAMLTLSDKTYPVLLKVAQISQGLVGLAYEGDIRNIQNGVFEYFVAEISGMEVNEVNPKLLKPDSRGEARWFFGSNNSEIYLTKQDEKLTYFHITLLGNYVECYADKAPKFGYVVSQEGQNKLKPDQANLIRFTEEMPESTLNLMTKFVQHVTSLSREDQALLLTVLEEIRG